MDGGREGEMAVVLGVAVVKSAVAFGFGGEGCFGCEVDGSIGRVL